MSDETIIARKNSINAGNQNKNGYVATEELHFDDFEAVARAVLRQRKISATVSNHLTPQFAEHQQGNHLAKTEKNKGIGPADQAYKNKPAAHAGNKVSIDADVFESVLIGLSQLVDSQRRFADEFGLQPDRVFSSNIKDMQQRGSSTVLRELLQGARGNASSKLDLLFEDLMHHQAGLLATLDTICRRTIKYLGSELTLKNIRGLARLGPKWPHYRARNKKISNDQQSRYKVIIAPGVALGYTKAKEKFITKIKK